MHIVNLTKQDEIDLRMWRLPCTAIMTSFMNFYDPTEKVVYCSDGHTVYDAEYGKAESFGAIRSREIAIESATLEDIEHLEALVKTSFNKPRMFLTENSVIILDGDEGYLYARSRHAHSTLFEHRFDAMWFVCKLSDMTNFKVMYAPKAGTLFRTLYHVKRKNSPATFSLEEDYVASESNEHIPDTTIILVGLNGQKVEFHPGMADSEFTDMVGDVSINFAAWRYPHIENPRLERNSHYLQSRSNKKVIGRNKDGIVHYKGTVRFKEYRFKAGTGVVEVWEKDELICKEECIPNLEESFVNWVLDAQ